MKIEWLKLKRSNLHYLYLLAALMGAIFPILVQTFMPDIYPADMAETPYHARLLNWGVVSFINALVIFLSGTLMYSIETEYNAINKMRSLPINELTPFINKISIIFIGITLTTLIQNLAMFLYVSINKGFYDTLFQEFFVYFISFFIYSLSLITISTFLNSIANNLWIPLGFNIVALFISNILSQENSIFRLIPYAMYINPTYYKDINELLLLSATSFGITLVLILLKSLVIKIRRAA